MTGDPLGLVTFLLVVVDTIVLVVHVTGHG